MFNLFTIEKKMLRYQKNRYKKNVRRSMMTLFFITFKAAVVARQSDINIASEWGPLAPSNK